MSPRDWRFGLAERIESIWDRVGSGDDSMGTSSRVVRDVVRDPNKSHDEMTNPERRRRCNFGKWYREKKLEMSTLDVLSFCSLNDPMLFDRVSFPLAVIEEMTWLRSPVSSAVLR